jgi:hypothetical protein
MTTECSDSLHACQAIRYVTGITLSPEFGHAVQMDTNEEVRRRRLQQLCEANGGVRAVADKADLNWQSLDQVIKGVLLPPKKNGDRSARSLGTDNARTIEAAFSLAPGWLDWPFDHVDFHLWVKLDSFQRAVVEGKMSMVLAEAAEKSVPANVRQKPVADKKVEQHFPALPRSEAKEAYERAYGQAKERSQVPLPELDETTAIGPAPRR